MVRNISGIHHVTAIAADPQRNVNFYTDVLGLRLVKITINYDDPGSYHFYYGDATGSPGSILTFFAWPGGRRGRRGAAQATITSFAVPQDSLGYWRERLHERSVPFAETAGTGAAAALEFEDPDGLLLRLVEDPSVKARLAWTDGPIPVDAAIRGFYSVTLAVRELTPTAALLTEPMGFTLLDTTETGARYVAAGDAAGRIVELVQTADRYGSIAVGNVHHVAWRTPDDDTQKAWRSYLEEHGYGVSPVMDRQYFHSIYFSEPGGILFEIATDPPGFTADEPLEALGSRLRLPQWLEPHRAQIERALPPLQLPQPNRR